LLTVTELRESPLVDSHLPLLWSACDHFASDQIRSMATVGGNICNASPAGDLLVPLLVLEAEVVLASRGDNGVRERRLPLGEFLVAPGRTRRESGELLVAVEVRTPAQGWVDRYVKFGARPALDISPVAIGVGGLWRGGVLESARLAFGAVAPTAIRAPEAERVLSAGRLDAARIEDTVRLAAAAIQPISDVRASEWYRRELVRNLLRRMLTDVCQS